MLTRLALVILPALFIAAATVPPSSTTPSASPTPTQAENQAAVLRVLQLQQIAWNRGDIEGFMNGYWRSHDTVFVSGDTVTRGWQTVHDRYLSKYPTEEKMGQLTFAEVEVRMFGYDGALVFGRWQLDRATDKPHGRFTVVLRKTSGDWKIVHDHTSTVEE
jgi:ketosteroid isomerase-like protein